jgi:hypothetical protein
MHAETPQVQPRVRADALERAERAWSARVAGATWAQAAEIAGYSDDTAANRAVRNVFGTLPQVERDELRRLWRDRLEVLWLQANTDAREQRAGAITAGVRVATAAASLDGLAEPARVGVDISFVTRIEQELVEHGI